MLSLLRNPLRLAEVAADPAQVSVIDEGLEVCPERVDVAPEGVQQIWRAVERLYATGTQPAISLCVRRKGRVILNRAIGYASGGGPGDASDEFRQPMTTATPVCLFSASKAVTAVLMHKLAEEGLINLLDPVSFYLPEFGQRGKRNITIHQILSHRGGIPGLPTHESLDTLYDQEQVWKLLCAAKPIAVDGGKLAYHAITGGFVLQRVLEKVTGAGIMEYLEQTLRAPLEMKYFTYGLEEAGKHAVARNYATGPEAPFPVSWALKRALGADMSAAANISNERRWMDAIIPAANLYATAEETSRFFQMLLNGGEWRGRRILQPVTVKRATQEFGGCTFDRTMMIPMRYSAGFMLGGDPVGLWGPRTERAFGHIGLINKFCWADPDREISVALLTSGLALLAHHLPRLAALIRQINLQCAPLAL
ncbi:serine hydrolase [Hahella sp. HN01]|uniref:serine hydrolase domain-containing protein n=1 Tax=Hahella sp. HN01 TaxID=2847262 RepID=UPI001C1E9EC9|nr:serine hydrolase domain-containing protein [Hahella sp. HN01]MBU6950226.1 beta-lactamase family protein [Hahella sp. HN01]